MSTSALLAPLTLGIQALGYEPVEKQRLLAAIQRPYGMILVTGPTGSGKTVSLYTCLNLLNKPGVNIATAEDPSEINLPGVNQVNVNEKTKVDVFQEAIAGTHMPIKAPAAVAASAPVKQGDFNDEITKIGQVWLHSPRTALMVKELAVLTYQHELTDEQFQSCIASIFIEANRKGLSNPPVLKPIGSAPTVTPAPEPEQQEQQENPF